MGHGALVLSVRVASRREVVGVASRREVLGIGHGWRMRDFQIKKTSQIFLWDGCPHYVPLREHPSYIQGGQDAHATRWIIYFLEVPHK